MTRRILTIIGATLAILVVGVSGLLYSWTRTPQGPMDLGAAIVVNTMPTGPLQLTPERRANANAWTAQFMGEGLPVRAIHEETYPGPTGPQRARVYVPEGEGPFPLLVWIHGGGWWMGEPLELWDGRTTPLAREVPAVVVSIDYRLAPEHPFPAAVEDCWAGLHWSIENAARWGADPSRVAVMGGSAGGNLAAVMAQRARDDGGPTLRLQVLTFPSVNLGGVPTESMRLFGEGFGLEGVIAMRDGYLPRAEDRQHPWASPMLADDFRGLAPALIVTAQFDPLRDEGEAYGARLREAGVPVEIKRFDGAIHGFLGSPSAAAEFTAIAITALQEAFGPR